MEYILKGTDSRPYSNAEYLRQCEDYHDNQMTGNHIIKSISSDIDISSQPEKIWNNITDVKIEQFSDPLIFKLLDIQNH